MNLGGNSHTVWIEVLRLNFLSDLLGNTLLLLRVRENGTAVLRAVVRTLGVHLSRVVRTVKELNKLGVRDLILGKHATYGIKGKLSSFSISGPPGAHLFIRRIRVFLGITTNVAHFGAK